MKSARIAILPGLLGNAQSVKPLVDVLHEAGAEVCVLPLPGHGPTPWGLELSCFDEVLAALGERLSLWRAQAVVGHSLGGRLALGLAARQLKCAVVACGAHPGIEDPEERQLRLQWDAERSAEVLSLGLPEFVRRWQQLPIFAGEGAWTAAQRQARQAARLSHTAEGIAWAFRVLGTGRMPRFLPEGASPRCVWMVGGCDTKYRELVERHVADTPALKSRIVEGAAHDLFVDAPREVGAVISELLA